MRSHWTTSEPIQTILCDNLMPLESIAFCLQIQVQSSSLGERCDIRIVVGSQCISLDLCPNHQISGEVDNSVSQVDRFKL